MLQRQGCSTGGCLPCLSFSDQTQLVTSLFYSEKPRYPEGIPPGQMIPRSHQSELSAHLYYQKADRVQGCTNHDRPLTQTKDCVCNNHSSPWYPHTPIHPDTLVHPDNLRTVIHQCTLAHLCTLPLPPSSSIAPVSMETKSWRHCRLLAVEASPILESLPKALGCQRPG
jgi:hypothetical protein